MSIIAKPVINKQFWILQKDNHKIGNIEATENGYQIKINNQVVGEYKTIKLIEKTESIHFEPPLKTNKKKDSEYEVHGYPTKVKVFNPIWNVVHKLPMYTTEDKSKSWVAAGWYKIKKGRNWSAIQDPKLILLERYPYKGPFFTKEEATNG